jgi:hypothetical protein
MIAATCCGFLALWYATLFVLSVYLPARLAVGALVIMTMWGLTSMRLTRISPLCRLVILLYAMPFSVTVGYLGLSDYAWWGTPTALALMGDRVLIEQMMAIGLAGLAALLAGLKTAEARGGGTRGSEAQPNATRRRSLDAFAFVTLLALAAVLSWAYAPPRTIFEEAYGAGDNQGLAESLNFYGAFLASYVLIVLLFVDAERSPRAARRAKFAAIITTTLSILVFFQLLRGDREIVGLIVALVILWVTEPAHGVRAERRPHEWRRIRILAVPILLLIVVLLFVGSARFAFSGETPPTLDQLLLSGLASNTWTAVLLTNLGMAAELQEGKIEYLYGETYLDYVLSLPPGILTRYLGVERRLEATSNPNYWFVGISSGGNHVVNVPFKNFGIFGVALVLFVYGLFIGTVEKRAWTGRVWDRFLYGAVSASSFMWFWYGDMNIVRGLMGAGVLGLAYRGWFVFTAEIANARRCRPAAVRGTAAS